MSMQVVFDRYALASAFTISRGTRLYADVLSVVITRDGVEGRGECTPYPRYGESYDSVREEIMSLPQDISRAALQDALPAGAARNAVDCALWDLEAKQRGKPVWELAGLSPPKPLITAYTLSLDTAENMLEQATKHAARPLLKIKLGGEGDIARIEAVRQGAPDARLIVDANEGWDTDTYAELAPVLLRLGVELVEQPLPAGADDALFDMDRPLPVCADESCHDRASLMGLAGKYDFINIKLDKTGGLTEALALREAARKSGFQVMVGCMIGSSLAMAPAVLVAQDAEVVDLDGPLLLAADRIPALQYDDAGVHPAQPDLWG